MIENIRTIPRIFAPKQSPVLYEDWHVWPVTIPRRSITGRLVWGTVLRRWDGRRWIYKKYVETTN
jgi:hypothetical protein